MEERRMKIQLLSTELGSQSLKRIAQALSQKLAYKVLRTRKVNTKRKQFNYGNIADKLSQYRWFVDNDIQCPEYTTQRNVAESWVISGLAVFCRTLTRASEGRGIVVAETVDQLVNAPVYTKYEKKKREFRVHIFKDKVVQIVEKRKRAGWQSDRDTRIRNTANGYVFCRSVVDIPSGLAELALKASKVTSSDFKGVDIGYNEKKNQLFVIEVNSAPGIEGSNVEDYANTIVNNYV
jgi:hypothetical protein